MSRDSQISYVHLTKSHHSLYVSNWVRDKLPHDDIENLRIDDDDNEITTNIQNLSFANLRNNKKQQNAIWKDLDLDSFLNEGKPREGNFGDLTILKSLNISDHKQFLDIPSPTINNRNDLSDSNISNASVNNNNNNNSNNNNLPVFEITTPVVPRNRPSQRSVSGSRNNFQTPVARTMR
ncbi:hypothetical protein WICMUC_005183 [Wickerhamomyces mucosus]|uniref:Anaphase-promoting complex subunit 13 n=1 Tax=Wickerhamomyces mucosus TaxID=1378264 RepID=A0A9P8P9Y0_9ASCO|nr:hypothetical protein WICMUC_005183 [Wickerhamomyces mucosus]